MNEQHEPIIDEHVAVPKHSSSLDPHPVSYGLDGNIRVLWEPNVTGDCHPKDILVPFTYLQDVRFVHGVCFGLFGRTHILTLICTHMFFSLFRAQSAAFILFFLQRIYSMGVMGVNTDDGGGGYVMEPRWDGRCYCKRLEEALTVIMKAQSNSFVP